MDIKKYEVLLQAVTEGSLQKASMKLDYSQSAVTQMMNSLEQELGFAILVRNNRGVFLTEEGKRIIPLIRELLNAHERLKQEYAAILGNEYGHVRIGSMTSMAIHWLPGIMEQFQTEHPQITIELLENCSRQTVEDWLKNDQVDLCFLSLSENSAFEQIELKQDAMLAVLPCNHKLKNEKEIPVECFAEEPFMMSSSPSGYEADIMKVLRANRVMPNVRFTSNFDQAIISMVAHNLGVTILPQLIMEGWSDGVITKPLKPYASRKLGIAVRSFKHISPAVRLFIDCALKLLQE